MLLDQMTQPGSGFAVDRQNQEARNIASQKEDQALKGALGSRRKLREGERMPRGSYALADFEGLGGITDWASTGNTPGGSAHIGLWLQEQSDPRLRDENMRKRQEWAAIQRALLGRY
jgi:hypothetical protein